MNTDIRPGKVDLHFIITAHMVFEEPTDIIYKIKKVFNLLLSGYLMVMLLMHIAS